MPEPFLKVNDLTKRFGDRTVVDRASLEAGEGEIVALLGASGCGKTTLLRLIAGLEMPEQGELWIAGQQVAAGGRNLVPARHRGIGFVFQDLALWPHLTVAGNLAFVLASARVPKSERRERITETLRLTRIEGHANDYPAKLSGGEQQRAALARALVARPRLLLLDEPLSSLDADLKADLLGELERLQRALAITTVYVTHDRAEATGLAHRVVLMANGRIEGEISLEATTVEPIGEPFNSYMTEENQLEPATPGENMPAWREVFLYFLMLGFINIGGPVAQITMMFNHMVERRAWLSKERFVSIMAFCHMLPGPEALQLAIYVGYIKRGILAGIAAGVTFIVPGALVMILLSWLYVEYGSLPQVNNALYILKPAVLGIIGAGIIKLGTATIKTPMLGILLVGAFVGMRFAGMNLLLVLVVAGVLNLLFVIRPQGPRSTSASAAFITSGFIVLGFDGKFLQLAWLFLKTGLFSFGGAYASLAFLQQGAVENHHWLTSSQFLDGVAMSVATPGPFMLFATFVGYMAAGIPGAIVGTVFVFLPSFVFVLLGARYVEQVRNNRPVQAFLSGVSAAVVGVILVVSIDLAREAIVGIPSAVIAAIVFVLIVGFKVDVAKLAVGAILSGLLYAGIRAVS